MEVKDLVGLLYIDRSNGRSQIIACFIKSASEQ